MIQRYIFFIVVCFSLNVNAAEFKASVSEVEVAYNDTFELHLKCTGVNPKGVPDIRVLDRDFEVVGTSNLSSTTIINGDVSTSREWVYSLKPKKKGEITIPSIAINTDSKELKSEPIKVKVVSSRVLPHKDSGSGIFVESSVTKTAPYEREPIILSLRLYTMVQARDISIGKIDIPDGIVQQIGTYNIYKATKGDLEYDVIEWKFNITPTKSGKLIIPGIEVRGLYTPKRHVVRTNIFDDPFIDSISSGVMSRISGGMKEFRLAFNEIVLNVKEPNVAADSFATTDKDLLGGDRGTTGWLPAKFISLSENWSSDEFVQGRPIKRSVVMKATGALDSQLPKIVMTESKDYKSYADPELKTVKFDHDIIRSSRTEYFTIIPIRSGKITFPEITVTYWDVDNKKFEQARLPAKVVDVRPSSAVESQVLSEGDAAAKSFGKTNEHASEGQSALPLDTNEKDKLDKDKNGSSMTKTHPINQDDIKTDSRTKSEHGYGADYVASTEIITKASGDRDSDKFLDNKDVLGHQSLETLESGQGVSIGNASQQNAFHNMMPWLWLCFGTICGFVIYLFSRKRSCVISAQAVRGVENNIDSEGVEAEASGSGSGVNLDRNADIEANLESDLSLDAVSGSDTGKKDRVMRSELKGGSAVVLDVIERNDKVDNNGFANRDMNKAEGIFNRKLAQKGPANQDIDKLSTIADLHKFLQHYAFGHWYIDSNTSLELILTKLEARFPGIFKESQEIHAIYKQIINIIYKHLYYEGREGNSDSNNKLLMPRNNEDQAKVALENIKTLKSDIKKVIKLIDTCIAQRSKVSKSDGLPKLNPY